MSKKIYDLSIHAQMQDEQRILRSESGKEYNVSFVPAIVNRKYYKRWKELQGQILDILPKYYEIRSKLETGVSKTITKQDKVLLDEFTKVSQDAADAGLDLMVYVMKVNGYSDFTEDELFENFSENGISFAIDFIMGLVSADDKEIEDKKKE